MTAKKVFPLLIQMKNNMKTPTYLQKIDKKLVSFAMDKDVGHLYKASELLRGLISRRNKYEHKKSVKKWSKVIIYLSK